MSLQYLRDPFEGMFDTYHRCSSNKTETIIFHRQVRILISFMSFIYFHRNGCGPTPELCHYQPFEDSEYWAKNSPNNHRWEVGHV